jgi:hypothetical protein
MYDKPEEPEIPDYYSALDISQDATNVVIKKAYHKLALKHHPDKHAPGKIVNAVEFRKVSPCLVLYCTQILTPYIGPGSI